jgi:hypothetical protein
MYGIGPMELMIVVVMGLLCLAVPLTLIVLLVVLLSRKKRD